MSKADAGHADFLIGTELIGLELKNGLHVFFFISGGML
jgi:hypothetical protein